MKMPPGRVGAAVIGPFTLLWHLNNISTAPSWLVFSNQQWQTQPRWLAGVAQPRSAQPLTAALERVDLGGQPEDAAVSLTAKSCCKAWMAFQPW